MSAGCQSSLQSAGQSRIVGDQGGLAPSAEHGAQALMLVAIGLVKGLSLFGVEQTRHHPDGA